MNTSKWIAATALMGMSLSLSACGGDEPGSTPPSTTPDDMPVDVVDETPDTPVDGPDARPDMTDTEPDMCMPKTACEDACGRVDDGCGGTLECGVCDCVNGTPTVPTCGQCGLGTASCDAQGVRSCDAPPAIPGLDGLDADACASALLYVAVGSGSNSEDGSQAAPYKSIEAALDAAQRKPDVKALLIGGANEYVTSTGVKVREGVSLIGGWDASWAVSADNRPIINSSATFDNGHVFGVSARDIEQPTMLYNLIIQTADAQQPGATNYGLHAVNAGGLVLKHLRITSGAGGNGVKGQDGLNGGPGGPGLAGPVIECSPNGNPTIILPGTNDRCPALECTGGFGGEGSSGLVGGAEPGGDAVRGGARGGSATSGSGQRGDNGGPLGPPGTPGDGGLSRGQVAADFWESQGDGGDGTAGANGGGGGGGAGAALGPPKPPSGRCPGNHGGSGGAGGQGGAGGGGGTSGGASIALFLAETNLIAERVSTFAGFGGAGGEGGRAGTGGQGGTGGTGGSRVRLNGQVLASPSLGGDGGNGANGQPGGHGGGGAGGPSYGAYCHNSAVTAVDGSASFSAGGRATGGASQGVAGEAGAAVDQHNCL